MQECKPYHFVMVEAKTTDDSPDLGELVEILGGARVQTIPLSYS